MQKVKCFYPKQALGFELETIGAVSSVLAVAPPQRRCDAAASNRELTPPRDRIDAVQAGCVICGAPVGKDLCYR